MSEKMSESEKQHRIAQVRTGLAFGGYELSAESEKNLNDIFDGKCTHDDVLDKICRKYLNKDGNL